VIALPPFGVNVTRRRRASFFLRARVFLAALLSLSLKVTGPARLTVLHAD